MREFFLWGILLAWGLFAGVLPLSRRGSPNRLDSVRSHAGSIFPDLVAVRAFGK